MQVHLQFTFLMHSIDYKYTDKNISAWGALHLFQELMERINFRDMLDDAGLPDKGSNSACEYWNDLVS